MKELDIALNEDIIITSKLAQALQELDILFNTERTELLGDTNFGSFFEGYLWEMNRPNDDVKTYIRNVMQQSYIFNEMLDDINVQMIDGEYRPIYIIQITLKDNEANQSQKRYYQFK